jgi:hypothetical protein
MSTWREERRKDQAAEAAERRRTEEHRASLRRQERRKDREEARAEKAQQRRDKAARRAARAAKREKQLTPANVYRKGTLALVATSAAAAIPAQVAYFVKKSWALLPVPFALEGAAWVMAAGVAYSDERKLPAWVRWLLRAFCVSAAGFAARINYLHGAHTSETVGWGLAAVTMLGPLFFEVRQWVMTLSASTVGPKQKAADKAKAKHEKKRRKDHKDVATLADKLVSAAPYGQLSFEDAFAKAHLILRGTDEVGMSPELHETAVKSAAALLKAQKPIVLSDETLRHRITARLDGSSFVLPTAPGTPLKGIKKPQVVTEVPPSATEGEKPRRKRGWRKPPPHRRSKGDSVPFHPVAGAVAADTARKHMAVNGSH